MFSMFSSSNSTEIHQIATLHKHSGLILCHLLLLFLDLENSKIQDGGSRMAGQMKFYSYNLNMEMNGRDIYILIH